MKYKISDILERKGYNLRRAGELIKCSCPFHNDPTPSFVIYPKTNSFYCFGCEVGGGPIQLLKLFGEKIPIDLLMDINKEKTPLKHQTDVSVLFEEKPIKKLRRIVRTIRKRRQQATKPDILNTRILKVVKAYRALERKTDENTTYR